MCIKSDEKSTHKYRNVSLQIPSQITMTRVKHLVEGAERFQKRYASFGRKARTVIALMVWVIHSILLLTGYYTIRETPKCHWIVVVWLPGNPVPYLYNRVKIILFQVNRTLRSWARRRPGCKNQYETTNRSIIADRDGVASSRLKCLDSSNQEVRLLHLSAWDGDDEIRINTEIAFLDDSP